MKLLVVLSALQTAAIVFLAFKVMDKPDAPSAGTRFDPLVQEERFREIVRAELAASRVLAERATTGLLFVIALNFGVLNLAAKSYSPTGTVSFHVRSFLSGVRCDLNGPLSHVRVAGAGRLVIRERDRIWSIAVVSRRFDSSRLLQSPPCANAVLHRSRNG